MITQEIPLEENKAQIKDYVDKTYPPVFDPNID